MYWAVRQICMAKHLRSRGWWGGWFTGQGENVHNGWLSLQHYRFTHTQLLPGLIHYLTPLPHQNRCCFHGVLSSYSLPRGPSFMAALPHPLPFLSLPLVSIQSGWCQHGGDGSEVLERGKLRWRCRWEDGHLQDHTLGIIRIYACSSSAAPSSLPAVALSVVRGVQRSMTHPWVRLIWMNYAF